MDTLGRDRLRDFIDLIVDDLDEPVGGEDMASRACLSRYHFDRLVAAKVGEPPGQFRRRLLLERSAWQLRETGASITRIALTSGYLSIEGFSRAFTRAYGISPGRYRKQRCDFRLDAPNGVHFHPPGGLRLPGFSERKNRMDFVDRIVGHDIWFTGQLLDLAGRVEPDDLDRPVVQDVGALTDSTVTLRELLNELVSTRENWSATLAGRDAPPEGSTTLDDLKRRFAVAGKEFASLVRAIRDRGEWDDAFVDALCDPPRSFTYGGMLAHVTTFSAVRRTMAVSALRKLGVEGVGLGDPIEWEHAVT